MSQTFNPFDDDSLTAHLEADPELKRNMLAHDLVRGPFCGRYWLSPKGKLEFSRRRSARADAIRQGLVADPSKAPAND